MIIYETFVAFRKFRIFRKFTFPNFVNFRKPQLQTGGKPSTWIFVWRPVDQNMNLHTYEHLRNFCSIYAFSEFSVNLRFRIFRKFSKTSNSRFNQSISSKLCMRLRYTILYRLKKIIPVYSCSRESSSIRAYVRVLQTGGKPSTWISAGGARRAGYEFTYVPPFTKFSNFS